MKRIWYVYILRCSDNSLYTGCTNDLESRVQAHNQGNGAKYTRARTPVKLVYSEQVKNRSQAQKREYEIKQLEREEKLKLVQHG